MATAIHPAQMLPERLLDAADVETLVKPSLVAARASLSPKKQKGAFYTPAGATQILAEWAVLHAADTVLEPSFGGCGFLVAVRDRLRELGNDRPDSGIFGCDLDPQAFQILEGHLDRGEYSRHFLEGDYLNLTPASFPQVDFDVVIGNPPYVSVHNMSGDQRKSARAAANLAGIEIGAKASLWAYFVIHSLQFLRRGGRMAWILPGSFVYADYSEAVRVMLAKSFKRSIAVILEERLFLTEGTEESTVVLLCEGFDQAGVDSALAIARAGNLADLQEVIDTWSSGTARSVHWTDRPQLSLISGSASKRFGELEANAQPLSDFFSVRIGIVTGANRFFILSDPQSDKLCLPPDVVVPIVAKFSHCRGLEFTCEDIQSLRVAGARCLFVDTSRTEEVSGSLAAYLERFTKDEIAKNRTFNKRSVWHRADDGKTPDGFFSCMQSDGPVLVLNQARVTCTNTVHRVFFAPEIAHNMQRVLAISLQSTFSQLSAEMEGRTCGSGGLKLEPSEVRRIRVLVPAVYTEDAVHSAFARVNRLLREGDRVGVRRAADEFLQAHRCLADGDSTVLGTALSRVRLSRSAFRAYRKDAEKETP